MANAFCVVMKRFALLVLCVCILIGANGCHRWKERRALAKEARLALRRQNYPKALGAARQLVQIAPHENSSWERFVQAYAGMNDLAGVKRALASWRVSVDHPSSRVDEFAGDVALAEADPASAVQFWKKALSENQKSLGVLEKIARIENQQHHWAEEDAAWTRVIALHDNALARVQRALCLRHLQKWDDAYADLHRAQQLAHDDPDVVRASKLFEHIGKFLVEIRELDARLLLAPQDFGSIGDRALLFLHADDAELALDDAENAAQFAPWAVRPKLFQALAFLALDRADECEKLEVEKFIRLDALKPEFLETVSRLDNDIGADRNNADLYVARAWQLNDVAQPLLALRDAQHATVLDANSAGAFAEVAYASMKLGRAEEAFDAIKRATDIDPNFSTAWQYRGELEMYRGDFLSAVESLTHALAINESALALQKREECYRHLGLYVKAEQDHRNAAELNARGVK